MELASSKIVSMATNVLGGRSAFTAELVIASSKEVRVEHAHIRNFQLKQI
jgi:hypothetical protein